MIRRILKVAGLALLGLLAGVLVLGIIPVGDGDLQSVADPVDGYAAAEQRINEIVAAFEGPADPHLHQLPDDHSTPAGVGRGGVVLQRQRATLQPGEIDDDIGALGRPQPQRRDLYRAGQQAAVAADDVEGAGAAAYAEGQVVGPRLGAIEQAQPVTPRLHFEVRVSLAVDHWYTAEEERRPDGMFRHAPRTG